MDKNKTIGQAGDIEILAEWEGPAVHEPGVLFDERLAADSDAVALAGWIAVTAMSGANGNSAYAAITNKVRGVLAAWRQRHGQARLDEVKRELLSQMQQHRKNARITDDELRERIDLLFLDIQD